MKTFNAQQHCPICKIIAGDSIRVVKKGLCLTHYQAYYRRLDPIQSEQLEYLREAADISEGPWLVGGIHDLIENLLRHFPDLVDKATEPTPEPTPPEPVTEPVTTPVTTTPGTPDLRGVLGTLADTLEGMEGAVSQGQLDALKREILEEVRAGQTVRLPVSVQEPTQTQAEPVHAYFNAILSLVSGGVNTCLVGPPGSGKTHMAGQIARALGLEFYQTGAILQKYELTGYQTATGEYIRSALRDAFEFGGLFLWDEWDASAPDAIVAFNALLENDRADFPDGMVSRHPDFRVIASANTYLTGATVEFVGRNGLDGASINRFAVVTLEEDERLACAISGVDADAAGADTLDTSDVWKEYDSDHYQALQADRVSAWADFVFRAKRSAKELGVRHIIGTRQVKLGAQLIRNVTELEGGRVRVFTIDFLKDILVWKGLAPDTQKKIVEGL
jgi:hypothetical protein